jgi:short-subunit dehydrogenase
MINVAVAGGTGGIGKTIVEELARGKKYNVVVLSRRVSHIHVS